MTYLACALVVLVIYHFYADWKRDGALCFRV
jgi:hypothetical protein